MDKYQSIATNRAYVTAFLTEEVQQVRDRLAAMQDLKIKSRDMRYREEYEYLQGMLYRLHWVHSLSPCYFRIAL